MAEVRYLVDDVESSIAFYRDHFDFQLKQQYGPAMAIVEKDDLTLWLAGPPSSARQTLADGTQPTPGGWARFVLQVEDIEAKVESLRDQGVGIRGEIIQGPVGKQVLCTDPSGNLIELFEAR